MASLSPADGPHSPADGRRPSHSHFQMTLQKRRSSNINNNNHVGNPIASLKESAAHLESAALPNTLAAPQSQQRLGPGSQRGSVSYLSTSKLPDPHDTPPDQRPVSAGYSMSAEALVLDPAQQQELRDMFDGADVKHRGYISVLKARRLLSSFGITLSIPDVEELLIEVFPDHQPQHRRRLRDNDEGGGKPQQAGDGADDVGSSSSSSSSSSEDETLLFHGDPTAALRRSQLGGSNNGRHVSAVGNTAQSDDSPLALLLDDSGQRRGGITNHDTKDDDTVLGVDGLETPVASSSRRAGVGVGADGTDDKDGGPAELMPYHVREQKRLEGVSYWLVLKTVAIAWWRRLKKRMLKTKGIVRVRRNSKDAVLISSESSDTDDEMLIRRANDASASDSAPTSMRAAARSVSMQIPSSRRLHRAKEGTGKGKDLPVGNSSDSGDSVRRIRVAPNHIHPEQQQHPLQPPSVAAASGGGNRDLRVITSLDSSDTSIAIGSAGLAIGGGTSLGTLTPSSRGHRRKVSRTKKARQSSTASTTHVAAAVVTQAVAVFGDALGAVTRAALGGDAQTKIIKTPAVNPKLLLRPEFRHLKIPYDIFVKMVLVWQGAAQFRTFEDRSEAVQMHLGNAVATALHLPDSSLMFWWQTLMLFSSTVTLFGALSVFTYQEKHLPQYLSIAFPLEMLMTIIFFLDIWVTFRRVRLLRSPTTGQIEIIDSIQEVAILYLTSVWFWIDLFASIPFRFFFMGYGDTNYIVSFNNVTGVLDAPGDSGCQWSCTTIDELRHKLLLAKVFVTLRTLKYFTHVHYFEESRLVPMSVGYVRRFFTIAVLLVDFSRLAVLVQLFSVVYLAMHPRSDEEANNGAGVVLARGYYLVLEVFSSVGYGDITPQGLGSNEEYYFMVLCVTGALVNGFVIGQAVSFFQASDIGNRTGESLLELYAMCSYFSLPSGLTNEIIAFYNYVASSNIIATYGSNFESIPRELQSGLSLASKIGIIRRLPYFDKMHRSARYLLCACLVRHSYCPEQFVINAGEIGNEMFFLCHGFVDVVGPGGKHLATLRHGANFGEMAILDSTPQKRVADVKALTFCEVFVLGKSSFQEIMNRYPRLHAAVKEIADARRKQMTSGPPPPPPTAGAAQPQPIASTKPPLKLERFKAAAGGPLSSGAAEPVGNQSLSPQGVSPPQFEQSTGADGITDLHNNKPRRSTHVSSVMALAKNTVIRVTNEDCEGKSASAAQEGGGGGGGGNATGGDFLLSAALVSGNTNGSSVVVESYDDETAALPLSSGTAGNIRLPLAANDTVVSDEEDAKSTSSATLTGVRMMAGGVDGAAGGAAYNPTLMSFSKIAISFATADGGGAAGGRITASAAPPVSSSAASSGVPGPPPLDMSSAPNPFSVVHPLHYQQPPPPQRISTVTVCSATALPAASTSSSGSSNNATAAGSTLQQQHQQSTNTFTSSGSTSGTAGLLSATLPSGQSAFASLPTATASTTAMTAANRPALSPRGGAAARINIAAQTSSFLQMSSTSNPALEYLSGSSLSGNLGGGVGRSGLVHGSVLGGGGSTQDEIAQLLEALEAEIRDILQF